MTISGTGCTKHRQMSWITCRRPRPLWDLAREVRVHIDQTASAWPLDHLWHSLISYSQSANRRSWNLLSKFEVKSMGRFKRNSWFWGFFLFHLFHLFNYTCFEKAISFKKQSGNLNWRKTKWKRKDISKTASFCVLPRSAFSPYLKKKNAKAKNWQWSWNKW